MPTYRNQDNRDMFLLGQKMKTTVAFYIPTALAEKLIDASLTRQYMGNKSKLVTEALDYYLAQLEQQQSQAA